MKIIYTILILLFNLQLFSQQKAVIPPLKSNSCYTASTSMPASYGITYTPSLAGDQNINTWWRKDVIDHIFVSKHFKANRWAVLTDTYFGKYPSDHFPVAVELIF